MSTTTEHLKALLADDGREFAMVRKDCLQSLMVANEAMGRLIARQTLVERKHGEERRRYMANNKALLAHNEGLQGSLSLTRDAQLWADHYLAEAETKIREAIRKAPATCRMLGLVE